MKSSPASPVAFVGSFSPRTERAWAAEVTGAFGSIVYAVSPRGLVAAHLDTPLPRFLEWFRDTYDVVPALDDGPFPDLAEQFRRYLDGEELAITAPVHAPTSSPFVTAVHEAITRIPYGETVTYGDIAALAGYPGAARAAGNACKKNRSLIAVPCHRVVAASGPGGFGGNVPLKLRLLQWEEMHREG